MRGHSTIGHVRPGSNCRDPEPDGRACTAACSTAEQSALPARWRGQCKILRGRVRSASPGRVVCRLARPGPQRRPRDGGQPQGRTGGMKPCRWFNSRASPSACPVRTNTARSVRAQSVSTPRSVGGRVRTAVRLCGERATPWNDAGCRSRKPLLTWESAATPCTSGSTGKRCRPTKSAACGSSRRRRSMSGSARAGSGAASPGPRRSPEPFVVLALPLTPGPDRVPVPTTRPQ